VDPDDLALMRRMDELYTKWPFYGRKGFLFRTSRGHKATALSERRIRL
jgi:hypothetical protein